MCSSQRASPAGPSGGDGEGNKAPASAAVPPTRHHAAMAAPPQNDEIEAVGLATGPADEVLTGSASPSEGRHRSLPRTRAKLIIDGAYLEASIKVAGEGRKGRLDHLVLLSLLEDRLDVAFDKKILFQATPDGLPNNFHRSISHPDGAHVKVVLQPMKARIVTVDIGGGLRQNQEIYLDKGVDLALALEILEPFDGSASGASPASSSSSLSSTSHHGMPVLVIVTGDGDLQPVIERAERSGYLVVVCGGRKTLSERLHQHVRKGSGQAVWLDDLVEQAWIAPRATTPTGSSSSSSSSTSSSSSSSSSISGVGSSSTTAGVASSAATSPSIMLGGPAATGRPLSGGLPTDVTTTTSLTMAALKTHQQQHHHHHHHQFHPAHHHLTAAAAAAASVGMGGSHGGVMGSPAGAAAGLHMPASMMPPLGLSSKQKLYRCPQGRLCDKLDEPGHLRALRHPCPKGPTCLFALGTAHGASDAERRDHMLTFVHICPRGTTCPRNDIEHCTHFDHPYRRTKARCPDGASCPFILRGAGSSNSSAREHSRMYRHPCPKGSTCPLLAGKQPSEKKRYHLMDYTHPCHVGCKYSVDKEWAWQHFSDFDHVDDGPDSRSNTTTEDEESVDHVILEGGWNYLDDAVGGAAGAAANWAPPSTPTSSSSVAGGSSSGALASLDGTTGGAGTPLGHSLFSQDFFKPFPPGSSSSSGSSGNMPAAGSANVGGAGLASMESMAAALQHASAASSSSSSSHASHLHQQQQQHHYQYHAGGAASGAGAAASPLRDFNQHHHQYRQQQQHPYHVGHHHQQQQHAHAAVVAAAAAGTHFNHRHEKGPQSPWRPS